MEDLQSLPSALVTQLHVWNLDRIPLWAIVSPQTLPNILLMIKCLRQDPGAVEAG